MKIDQESCFVCGCKLPYGQGKAVYHAFLRIRYCNRETCRGIVDAANKDYAKSKRGRHRTRSEMLSEIERAKRSRV